MSFAVHITCLLPEFHISYIGGGGNGGGVTGE